LPEPRGIVDDSPIGKELREIAADRPGRGSFGRADLTKNYTDLHRRSV
jgi:hypothetical protein